LQKIGYQLKLCTNEEWAQKLNELPQTHPAYPVKFLLEKAVFSGILSSLPKPKTDQRLKVLGIKPAEITDEVITKCIEFLVSSGNFAQK